MSLMMMIGAGALLLLLAVLLVLQRRRAAAQTAPEADAGETAAADDTEDGDWRAPGTVDRALMLLRGRGAAMALLRNGPDEIRIRHDRGAIRLANHHESVYGNRPNWDHIAALTLAMGKAERCFPGAELSGVLRYIDKAVPVEYSPPLVADLEDGSAPDPRETATTG